MELGERERLTEGLVREPERGGRVGAAAAQPAGDRDALGEGRAPVRLDAGARGERDQRGGHERVLGEAVDAEAVGGCEGDPVGEVDTLEHGRHLVLPVGAMRADDKGEVELRGCRGASHRRAASSGGYSSGASSSARVAAGLPMCPSASAASAREATPASSSELGSVLRRWANAASTSRFSSGYSAGKLPPAKGDERRVDVRRRSEHRPGDRVEAGPLRRELEQDGDGAVRLRPRHGEEAVGDLALHHHAPLLERRQAVERLDDDRRRDVVGQVRDELARGGVERGEVELQRVAEDEVDVRASASSSRSRGSSDRSTSTAWTCATRSARKRVRTPRPGPTSRTTSSARSAASRSITRRMFSSARKCWP